MIHRQLAFIQKEREEVLRLIITLPKSYIYDLVYNVYVPANFEEQDQKKGEEERSSNLGNSDNNYQGQNDNSEEEEEGEDVDEDEDEYDEEKAASTKNDNELVQDISVLTQTFV